VVSHASTHPVHCARRDDLACTASFPGSKWAAVKAGSEGWFFSRAEDKAYCPAHEPDWVPAWRARRGQARVTTGFEREPALAVCRTCVWSEEAVSIEDLDYQALRERAFGHAKTGHLVTVTTRQVLTLTPEREAQRA
jgi:hypothetical protein